ncbi:MAG: hypothetical protein ACR2N3_04695, partial [Pyrinomonadaceae bacterium]
MSTITSLYTDETGDTSRGVINTNFTNLNNDKSETTHNHTGVYEPANVNIQAHISNVANPHAVTKTQVNLGNLDNYVTASQVEAETGTASDRFMTPLRVAQELTALNPGFALLADVTLLTANPSLSTPTFAAKNILKIYVYCVGKSTIVLSGLRFNGDTTANYAYAGAASAASQTFLALDTTAQRSYFSELSIVNFPSV